MGMGCVNAVSMPRGRRRLRTVWNGTEEAVLEVEISFEVFMVAGGWEGWFVLP